MSSLPAFLRSALAGALALLLLALASGCRALGGDDEVRGWRLRFRGAEELDASELRAAVREDLERFNADVSQREAQAPAHPDGEPQTHSVRAEIALEDAVWSLERVYRNQGFVKAEVHGMLTSTRSGATAARFDIVEGPRVEIEKLDIRGNRSVASKELETFFQTNEGGLFESRKRWYVQSQLRDGARSIAQLYTSLGYLDATVAEPRATFSEDGTKAHVTLEIVEGRRYVLGEVRFDGERGGLDAALDKLAREGLGRTYSPALPRALRGQAEELLGRRGYADARVRLMSEERRPDGKVELHFQIQTGPVVELGAIEIHGNRHTNTGLVRDALDLSSGEIYDARDMRRASERLQNTGLFSSVHLELEGSVEKEKLDDEDEGGTPAGESAAVEQRTLKVELEEVSRREIYAEPSYGSYERFRLKAGWRERNLFGGGRELNSEGTLGEFAQDLRLGLGDPRVFGTDARGDATLFTTRRKEPSFTKTEYGGSFTVSERFSREFQGSATYSLRKSRSSDVDTSDPDITDEIGSVDISSVKLALLYDARDDPFAPRAGFLARGSIEYAASLTGSQLDFLRGTWTASDFIPLWRGAVLGTSWRAGLIAPLEGTSDIPLQERFFNGGENSVRSFHENALGPRDANGEVIGGEAFHVLSAELRHRLIGHLDGALFFDVGNVEPDYRDFFEFNGTERALGIGVRYMLPVGPIRLDAGFNPWHDASEDAYVVHLSVGMSF